MIGVQCWTCAGQGGRKSGIEVALRQFSLDLIVHGHQLLIEFIVEQATTVVENFRWKIGLLDRCGIFVFLTQTIVDRTSKANDDGFKVILDDT